MGDADSDLLTRITTPDELRSDLSELENMRANYSEARRKLDAAHQAVVQAEKGVASELGHQMFVCFVLCVFICIGKNSSSI